MHSRLIALAFVAMAAAFAADARADARVDLPVSFEGNAIVFTPRLAGGAPVRVLLDSGGYDLTAPAAVARCFADAALVARWHRAHPDWDYAATGAQGRVTFDLGNEQMLLE